MPPKKNMKKMDLGSFLADDSFGGSWADDDVDMSSISVPTKSAATPFGQKTSFESFASQEPRRERVEYPIPESGPYKAKVSNLSWEITEEEIAEWFARQLNVPKSDVGEVSLPIDTMTGKLRGFGFITFPSRDLLEESLKLTGVNMGERRVFVSVAAPEREELDWGAARGGFASRGGDRNDRGDRPRREEPNVDWSASRGPLPPREGGFRREDREGGFRREEGEGFERKPRREEPEIDWSASRSGPLPPREGEFRREGGFKREEGEGFERKPRREDPNVDWSASRGPLPPREGGFRRENRDDDFERKPKREEPVFDWSAPRSGPLPPREKREFKPRADKPVATMDWKRGETLPPKRAAAQKNEEKILQTHKSAFNALSVSGDETEEAAEIQQTKPEVQQTELEKAAAALTINEVGTDGWEVVSKK
ncbi:hypothetical protein BABINDRAFT_169725 [Babjeviella inositovora NRRL Y-12698]|uniref:RRM domain-containing protein n=1 Tax=Babjeviella inositovora NRRL Y-12698 TaxID=984486 RepID=A0A1E3QXH2_9ASCO|nr:uncharacterized protein BABINDRAFT_169725 [Babjeviella inositovora NRRL Y-12698]ODQ82370.1 hypothetical protein BABINDRAFT_169725 [Babjeviella inositovora NRRL Y-12698]